MRRTESRGKTEAVPHQCAFKLGASLLLNRDSGEHLAVRTLVAAFLNRDPGVTYRRWKREGS